MGRRTKLLTGVFTLLVALIISGGVYLTDIKSNQATVSAWEVTQKVSPGQQFGSQNVEMVQIQSTDRSLLSVSPNGEVALHTLGAGDILRNDDVTRATSEVEVLLTLQSSPTTTPGDMIDVYTPVNTEMVLIGKHLQVVDGGNNVTVMVPAQNEGYWLSLVAGGTKLYAVVVEEPLSTPDQTVNQGDAISQLSGIDPSQLGTPASPSTTPSPSTPPTGTPSPTPTPTPKVTGG